MAFGMDPEVAKYFKKILNSLFAGLLWLLLNITGGIYYGFAFNEDGLTIVNVLFYAWLIISLALLLWFYYRVWRK
ncbi:MAG: hypothetical protein EPN92_05315 [Chitinophagaceae bacterium]|nr:MAG: hypothetical protein EPN92_05315 [Chitinophagaceae bacterium]